MGLFQRKANTGNHAPLYTLGSQKTVLVVGLGNVGKQYDRTRHNIGFECVDVFAHQHNFPQWIEKKDLKCSFTKNVLGDTNVILIKPTTYMNNSGESVQAVQHFYKIANSQTLVVHDELDLPFGHIKTKVGGSDAGHNGIKSLIQHSGADFGRIRIGIRNERAAKIDSSDFVLMTFSHDELEVMPTIFREVSSLINEYLAAGTIATQTRTVTR